VAFSALPAWEPLEARSTAESTISLMLRSRNAGPTVGHHVCQTKDECDNGPEALARGPSGAICNA